MTSVVFFGTPDFSIPFLDALHSASNFDIVGVVTQPDKPVGRKQVLTPSPVKVRALELELPVLELKNLKSDRANSKLKTLNPAEPGLATPGSQLFVVVAYGKIIPASILELAPAINVHPSLLPKYRGPSPMQSAILNGDAKTGISIMLLNQGMDSGPILAQQEIALSDQESTQTLEAKVCQLGPKLLLDTIDQFLNNKIKPIPQNEAEATVCTMLERSDAEITWNESLEEIDRKIRAFDPWPGTYFELAGNNRRLSAETLVKAGKSVIRIKIIKACLDKTGLNLLEVQPAGKKPMSIDQFINGYLS